MQQCACLVINQFTVDNFITLLNCTPADQASDSMMNLPIAFHFSWLGLEFFRLSLGPPGQNGCSSVALDFQRCLLAAQGSQTVTKQAVSVASLLLHSIKPWFINLLT